MKRLALWGVREKISHKDAKALRGERAGVMGRYGVWERTAKTCRAVASAKAERQGERGRL